MTIKEQINWCKNQIKQGYEVVVIASILNRLIDLSNQKEPPSPYYAQAIAQYKDFLAQQQLPFIFNAIQGQALKNILNQLQAVAATKTPEGAYQSFCAILQHWDRTGDYLSKNKQLTDINRNLLKIIDNIKNGATKKQAGLNEAQRFHNQLTNQQQ